MLEFDEAVCVHLSEFKLPSVNVSEPLIGPESESLPLSLLPTLSEPLLLSVDEPMSPPLPSQVLSDVWSVESLAFSHPSKLSDPVTPPVETIAVPVSSKLNVLLEVK